MKTEKVTRIVNDISLNRFVKEIIGVVKKHPDAELSSKVFAEDDSGADNAFMFTVKLDYTQKKDSEE